MHTHCKAIQQFGLVNRYRFSPLV